MAVFSIPVWGISFTLLTILVKWIVIGRYSPGRHPLYGWFWLRWWYVDRLLATWEALIGVAVIDTLFLNFFYRLLGAHVPLSGITLSTFLREPDLVTIGKGCTVEGRLLNRSITPRELILEHIRIGSRCTIGDKTLIEHGSVLEDNVRIHAFGHVPPHVVLPPSSTWVGNPLRQVGNWKGSRGNNGDEKSSLNGTDFKALNLRRNKIVSIDSYSKQLESNPSCCYESSLLQIMKVLSAFVLPQVLDNNLMMILL
mmetsp:Transcript_16026/g.22375  ORF Transcript_16026/g.22375 Transcript_16026/m.22375 type:complete len:254 (-) Transcript_16026:10-771(-)